MKILLSSLLKRKVTADINASRSRIIYQLARGLIAKGHEVTILGTGDSVVAGAKIIPIIPKGFLELSPTENPFYTETGYLVQQAREIEKISSEFDLIHNHTYPEFINLLIADKITIPMITTIHAQATPELDQTLSFFPNAHLVGLSKSHKAHFTHAKIEWIVYNGVDTSIYAYQEKKEDYLLWLGRLGKAKDGNGNFMDAKGIKWAIKLAEATGQRLCMSGNVEDPEFFNRDVKPHLNEKITWIGSVSHELSLSREEVVRLMQGAHAFLMPINWEEPFGLVMAEAGSCGTPVIAFRRGSVPEIVQDGLTGFVVDPKEGLQGLKDACANLPSIAPSMCRKYIEGHFTIEKMVDGYLNVYKELLSK